MDLTDREKGILQKIVTEDSFELMKRVADSLLLNFNKTTDSFETEWMAAKDAIGREERKRAMISFFQTLEELAQGHDR